MLCFEGPHGIALGARSYAHNLLCELLHLGKGITYHFCIQMDSDWMHSGWILVPLLSSLWPWTENDTERGQLERWEKTRVQVSWEFQEESGPSEKCCRQHANHASDMKIHVCMKGKLRKHFVSVWGNVWWWCFKMKIWKKFLMTIWDVFNVNKKKTVCFIDLEIPLAVSC